MKSSKTVTPRKLEANRANAQKSTGPKSPEGKFHSRFNAVTHGLSAGLTYVAGQLADEPLAELAADLRERYAHHGPVAELLIDSVLVDFWRQRQALAAERALIEKGSCPYHREGNMDTILRSNTASRRALLKGLETLERLSEKAPAEVDRAAELEPAEPAEAQSTLQNSLTEESALPASEGRETTVPLGESVPPESNPPTLPDEPVAEVHPMPEVAERLPREPEPPASAATPIEDGASLSKFPVQ